MNPETIALLVKWGPLALVAVVFIWFFVVGVIRGTYKVMRRMIYVVLYVVLIWLFIEPITNLVLSININIGGVQGVRNFIVHAVESNAAISKFLNYSPDLKGLIIDSPEIVVSPVLFLVLVIVVLPLSYPIYWIYLIIFNLIAKFVFHRQKYEVDQNGEFLRNEKGKKIKVKRNKRRLLGGLLRGVQGVLLICLTLLPVNMINRIYNKAKKNAELEKGETLCDVNNSLDNYKDICGYIDIYNETIFAKLGGEKSLDKIITDRLTTVEYNGKKLSLENELGVVAVSAVLLNDSGILELFKNGEFNLEAVDFKIINFDKLDLLVDTLFSSSLISEVSNAGLKYVMNEVVKDDLVKLLKDDDIVSKLEYQNPEEIKKEFKDVVSILKFAVEKNLVDNVIDNKDDVVTIVNSVNSEDVETLLNKILSLRILSRAMPSVIEAYGEKYGVETLEEMNDEHNKEVADLFGSAVKLVQTLDLVSVSDLKEGNMLDNIIDALFEEGVIKGDTKEELATLLNDLNQSHLFKNVLSSQINKLLEKKDYKVDGRVLNYVDSKEAWLKELSVLDNVYSLYSEYKDNKLIDYSNVTSLLNDISGTKVVLSVLPFAYDELLPKVGLEVNSERFPIINFEGGNEDATKKEFYDIWEAELVVLKNVADAVGVLELQSLEDIDIELLDDANNVDALATVMSELYSSKYLKDPMVSLMKDTINGFVTDFNVSFIEDDLLFIDTKDKWKNEFSNINTALGVDLSVEENITGENLNTIFTAIGNMKLFDTKRVQLLKYVVKTSEFLTDDEYESISWPASDATPEQLDAFWNNETSVLVSIVEDRNIIKSLATTPVNDMNTDEIGGVINKVMGSEILSPIVVNKVSELLIDNGVKDDRDDEGSALHQKESINGIQDWKVELAIIKELINSIDSISVTEYLKIDSYNTYYRSGEEGNYIYTPSATGDYIKVGDKYYFVDNAYRYNISGEEGNYVYEKAPNGEYLKVTETRVDDVFETIEDSELLKNSRANLLLKAVDMVGVSTEVKVDDLTDDGYMLYNQEIILLKTFAHNINVIEGLGDNISVINVETKSTIAELLDDMKLSAIFKGEYVTTVGKVLANIDSAIKASGYDDLGVSTNKSDAINGYVNIEWEDEINTLSTVSANIEEMSKYNSDNITENKEAKIAVIGSTLEAIETSSFLGATNCQIIANSVIRAILDEPSITIEKPTGQTWTDVFNDALLLIN